MASGGRRGFILVLAMGASATLFFFALMYVHLYRAEQSLALQGERTLVAWEAASAGIQMAGLELKKSAAWSAGFDNRSLPDSGATVTVTFDATRQLPYSVNNSQNTAAVNGWGGRVVPPGCIHLVAVGRFGLASQVDQAMVVPPQSPYSFGLFGSNAGSLGGGTVVDAYNSAVGPYPSSLDAAGGNIGTNTTATGKITLASGSIVNGKIQVGPGGSASVIKSQGGTYQGMVVPTLAWPSAPVSPSLKIGTDSVTVKGTMTVEPGAYKDLGVNAGATLVLKAGTYLFNKVNLGDNVTVTVASGPVNLWFAAGLQTGKGNQINAGGVPGSLNFFGASTSSGKVTVDANSVGSFTLYAPWSDLNLNNSVEIQGSLLGKTFQTGTGVKIHLDQALLKQTVAFNLLTQW